MSPQICRLCLKTEKVPNSSKYISIHVNDNGVPIATLMKTLVPELFLGLSVNPVICPPCYDSLRDAYSFRLQCLRSEKLISIFIRETHCATATIVLQDVVNYWQSVYKKPCQTDVARDNLAEWFGVALEEGDRDTEQEACTRGKEEQVILNSMLKSNNLLSQVSSLDENSEKEKFCNCQQRDDCPTSAKFRESMNFLSLQAQLKIREEHFRCVVICEKRHSAACIFSRYVKVIKQKDNPVSSSQNLMRPSIKTYKKQTKTTSLPENVENYSQLVSSEKETVQIKPGRPIENISTSESPPQKNDLQSEEDTRNATCSQIDVMSELMKQIKANNIDVDVPSDSSEKSAHTSEIDEESLGIITFNPDLKPSEQTDKPMPMIRVRPVASLQKVRTLNHELFEQSTKLSQSQEGPEKAQQTLKDDSMRPIVLNSSIGFSKPHTEPKNPNAQMKIEKLIPVSLEHVKKMGVNPKELRRLKLLKPLRKVLPKRSLQSAHAEPVNVNVQSRHKEVFLGPTGIGDGAGSSEKYSGGLGNEDIIDIKDEPLDYDDRDSVNESEALDEVTDDMNQWDGETTRSSSETSLLERLNNENISNLISDIPEVADEQFDEPEYVHINNVSFADITKLMTESQKPKKMETLPGPNTEPPNLPQISKSFVTKRIEALSKKNYAQAKRKTNNPVYKPVYKSRSTNKSRGTRLRLVPVDNVEGEISETPGNMSFRRTIVRPIESMVQNDQNNVCVLFTNFTSEGDYINDHDYLINPYVRNKMSCLKQGEETCICLLCDYEHPADRHVQHMKFHSTTCAICRIDFNNVFILNLHVRGHTSRCSECCVRVTYARYRHHAETHNKTINLSNIDIPPELPRPKPARVETKNVYKRNYNPSKSGLRRSRRLTRFRINNPKEPDEEEACIYDKATKSFITPTVDKQQKLLARCSTEKNETEKIKPDQPLVTQTNETKKEPDIGFMNITNLDKSVENLIVNYPEKIKGKQRNMIRTNKRKRRRLFTTKKQRRELREKHVENSVEEMQNIKTEENAVDEPERETWRKNPASESETSKSPEGNLGTKDPPKEESTRKKSPARRKSPKSEPSNSSLDASFAKSPTRNELLKESISQPHTDSKNPTAEIKIEKAEEEEIARKKSPTRRKSPKTEPSHSSSNASDAKNLRQNELSKEIKIDLLAKEIKLRKPQKVVSNKLKFAKKSALPQLSTNGDKAKLRRTKPSRETSLGGDLKIKIGGIKLNRFVTLPSGNDDIRTGESSVAAEAPLKLIRIRKRKRKNSRGNLKLPVLEAQRKPDHSENNPVETDATEQPELVLKKDDGRTRWKKKVETNVVLNPVRAESRSSRSRGSLNLVEGLKIDGPSRSKKSRKSLPSTIPSSIGEQNVTSSQVSSVESTIEKSIEAAVECGEIQIVDIKGNTNIEKSDPELSKLESTETSPTKENPVEMRMDLDEERKKETEESAAKLHPECLTEEKSVGSPMDVDEEDNKDLNLANLFKEAHVEIHMEVDEENGADDTQPSSEDKLGDGTNENMDSM